MADPLSTYSSLLVVSEELIIPGSTTLTFVEWSFSGLVGDVGLGPSLQQGEQAVQVAPAGSQVESCLLVESALVNGARVRCEETKSPKSPWQVVHKYLQHCHPSILSVLGEFPSFIPLFVFSKQS